MIIKIISILLIALFSLTIVSGAAADRCIQTNLKEKQLTVKVDQNFNINLKSNPTTGYNWESDYDPKYIQLVDEKYISNNPMLIGSNGKTFFKFKALKPGETDITFKYFRSWENCLPSKEIIYHLKIQEIKSKKK